VKRIFIISPFCFTYNKQSCSVYSYYRMGSPFLGDFEGVDKETGKFMFSLEANNLVDEVSTKV
jgi:hypothetical protein